MEAHDEIKKIEKLIEAMQETDTGIIFKTQKVFLTTIPAAVSGDNLITWLEHYLNIDDPQEAAHIANVLLLYGYIYPLTDYKSCIVKDDPTAFYRFQAPYYWVSKISRPDAMDYAIYLVKRTLHKRQKYGLEDYEHSALERLRIVLAHKWDFICMQAADQVRLYKDKRKSDQIVLEAQERAFWRVHRPPPSRLSCFEERLPRNLHMNQRLGSWRRAHASILLNKNRATVQQRSSELTQPCRQPASLKPPHIHMRLSNRKSIENLLLFTSNRSSYDWFLCESTCSAGGCCSSFTVSPWLCQPGNFLVSPCMPLVGLPTCDSLLTSTPLGSCLRTNTHDEVWTESFYSSSVSSPTINQVRLWATSFDNLLWDPDGCQAFKAFLEKEFSSENLRFWLSVNAYQFTSVSKLKAAGRRIYEEFLAPNAPSEINIDCITRANAAEAVKNASWFVFLEAKQHIYKLMKSDSYTRFLRSDDYSNALRVALANTPHPGGLQSSRRSLGRPPLLTTATSSSSALDEGGHTARSTPTPQKSRGSN